jgi:UPF0755 protein
MTRGYEPVTEEIGFLPGGDYGDYRPSRADRRKDQESRRKRKRRRFAVPLVALIVLALLGGAALYGGKRLTDRFGSSAQDFPGDGTGSVSIRVQPGDTATDIAATLVAKGVVASEKPFREAAKADPRSVSIQPGVYQLRKQMSGTAALTLLLDPGSRLESKVTIPEGYSVAQILAAISRTTKIPLAELQAAAKNTKTLGLPTYAKGRLEGFLFPATYDFDPEAKPADILKKMVGEYVKQVDDSGLSAKAAAVDLSPYELLTVASLVERETLWDTERPKVATVIYNRLDQDYYLGVDASILYGLGRTTGALTKSDLAKDTPYNNRLHKGLPPTPIASPGIASITAATQPAKGPWLYYVLRPDGKSHIFTDDQETFNQAKAACQAAGKC